ncbi:MAG: redoxin domain-containing protein [Elusimicrobia bacterium]|nr:redoxin domain-containing protein [Elusimicrobiota bacterium]
MRFRGGPRPGEPFPDFDLPTIDGSRVRKDQFVGQRPVLVTLGSATCPMTLSASPALKSLYRDYEDRLAFLTLYVREPHPGDQIRQPRDVEEKFDNARLLQRRDDIPWPIAVDGLEGEIHEQLGRHPNAAYLLDIEGRVAYRALWSNAVGSLRCGIEAVLKGEPAPIGEDRRNAAPILRGLGCLSEAVAAAGPQAERDLLRHAPPVYVLGKVAGAFKPLPPAGRGLAALAVAAFAVGALWRTFARKEDRDA